MSARAPPLALSASATRSSAPLAAGGDRITPNAAERVVHDGAPRGSLRLPASDAVAPR